MPEVLEIQIQDKGGSAASATTPPRPPAAVSSGPAGQPASGGKAAPTVQPASGAGKAAGIAEQLADTLGYGKQFRAVRQFFQSLGSQKAAVSSGPASQQAGGRKAATGTFQGVVEQHFVTVEGLLGRIVENTAGGSAHQPAARTQKAAEAKVQQSDGKQAKQPASKGIKPNAAQRPAGNGDTAKPPMPRICPGPAKKGQTAAEEPVRAPATPQAGGAVAGEAGEAAGAAGGALAGVAAVAVPVAVAFGAVYAAVKLTEAAFKLAGQTAEVMGQQMSMMARNNYIGMFQQGLDLSTKALAKVPLVGGMLSSAMGAASAGVKAFTSVTEAFTQRAHELAAFSPAIAMAEQRQAMRSLFDDIKEAQQLGPGLERMLDAETNLQHDLREMFLPIKKVIVEVLADFIEKARDWLPDMAKVLAGLLDLVNGIVAAMDALSLHVAHKLAEPVEKALGQMAKSLREIKKNTDKEKIPDNDIFLADLFNGNDWNFNGADPWRDVQGDPRPNIPLAQAFAGL